MGVNVGMSVGMSVSIIVGGDVVAAGWRTLLLWDARRERENTT